MYINNHRKHRRKHVAALIGLSTAAGLLPLMASSAQASPQTQSIPLAFDGSTGEIELIPATDNLICDDCIPDEVSQLFGIPGKTAYGGQVSASAALAFEAPASLGVTADPALLEEGTTLDVTDALVPLPGTLSAEATYSASLGFFNDANGTDDDGDGEYEWVAMSGVGTFSGSVPVSSSAPCMMPMPGTPAQDCVVDFGSLTIIDLPILPELISVDLRAHLTMTASITADGLTTVRDITVTGGPTLASGGLEFSGNPGIIEDPVAVPCGPAGKSLVYDVGTSTYDSTTDLNNTLSIQLAFDVPDPISDPAVDLFPIAQIIHNDEPLSMTSGGDSVELGQIKPDSEAPTLTVNGPFAGNEGAQIPLSATAIDNCGVSSLVWHLSDGGTEYGASPVHKFADDGDYSGLVVATDARGNTSSETFKVTVDNLPPIGNAGPDHTAVWGVPVAFNGSAIDPGSGDQGTLEYAWSFGDGTPSATGGSSVNHGYSKAGNYTATLDVCDDDGACDPGPDSRVVHVTKRETSLAYSGATFALPKKTVGLSASVVDELGQPVPGRTVKFTLGTQTVSAQTGANGTAVASLKIGQKTGPYTMLAELVLPAGEGRYLTSSDSTPFTIGK